MGLVEFNALTEDASKWDGAAQQLGAIETALNGIDVYRGAFSFAAMDVFDEYVQVRDHVLRLLREGAGETAGAATALRRIRTDLEANENAAINEFGGMWAPVQ
ncbi:MULTISPECIES: hypothetical protein [Microbacterium]|uniref:hypothetical protein n=1 Tax=Microbacterium TaxID=33882 RepID=UPI0022F0584F|nr:hypothetical protein [Streptomyces sp. MS2A]